MLLREKRHPLPKETAKFTRRFRNSTNYDQLISMFRALSLEDNKTVSKAPNAMEIDEAKEDVDREEDYKIQATFDPMDIDEGAEAHVDVEHYNARFSPEGGLKLRPVRTIMDTLTVCRNHNSEKRIDSSDKAPTIKGSYDFPSVTQNESQPEEFSLQEPENMHKRDLRRVIHLTHRLTGHDPARAFADNCQKAMPDWIALLRETTLPSTIASSDPLITAAFRTVDSIVLRQESTYLIRRLAYFQLMRLFETLEAIIESERKKGVHYASGYGNISIAIDIYIDA